MVSITNETSASPVEPSTGPIALAGAPRPAGQAPKSKPRKRVNTAEKRHQHNAIERQRRETLNGKFLVLARILPSLASCRRPSKSAIVNGSISHLNHQRSQRLLASKLLRQLAQERDELFAEVNEWRAANGFTPKAGPIKSWNEEMEEVCAVEKETFGSFASVDDGGEDAMEEDESVPQVPTNDAWLSDPSMNIEQAAVVAGTAFGPGSMNLLQPRPSTDSSASAVTPNAATPAAMNPAINWNNYAIPSSNQSVNFSAFMTETASSTGSPVGSTQQNVLSPSSMDTANLFTYHTPSPRSSTSADDVTAATASARVGAQPISRHASIPMTWTPQQVVHHNMPMQPSSFPGMSTSPNAADFGTLFLSQQPSVTGQQGNNAAVAQLMAAMFPQRDMSSASAEHVDQWRKLALSGFLQQQQQQQAQGQPQAHSPQGQQPHPGLKNTAAVNLGFGWNEQAVEGF